VVKIDVAGGYGWRGLESISEVNLRISWRGAMNEKETSKNGDIAMGYCFQNFYALYRI